MLGTYNNYSRTKAQLTILLKQGQCFKYSSTTNDSSKRYRASDNNISTTYKNSSIIAASKILALIVTLTNATLQAFIKNVTSLENQISLAIVAARDVRKRRMIIIYTV